MCQQSHAPYSVRGALRCAPSACPRSADAYVDPKGSNFLVYMCHDPCYIFKRILNFMYMVNDFERFKYKKCYSKNEEIILGHWF